MSKLVCLDPGHGGTDPGASGNGLKEKEITLKLSKKIGELLKKQGVSVVYTREADVYVALGERCRIANSKDCDCFVSIHINSAAKEEADGIETLCYTKNNLATFIQQNLIKELKLTDRGIKERKELYVLNSTEMQAVLVELGFISNEKEARLLKGESFLNRAAECVAKGICKYLKVDYKEEERMTLTHLKRTYKYKGKDKEFFVINVDGSNYISVRELAELLGKSVVYENETKVTEILD